MKAELIDSMGSDLTVVNAARVSFDKQSEWEEGSIEFVGDHGGISIPTAKLSDRDTKLINYLARHDHFTPFTHCMVTLRETVPIFVARQRFKHTVGFSYNEISRRYVDDEPEFYAPDVWRKRADNKKQGSSDEAIETMMFHGVIESWEDEIAGFYWSYLEDAQRLYESMIKAGVAPEQARMVLPQSMYTSYYVTGSLYAYARAYNLRSTPDAQAEIQELASHWDKIIRPLFPVSWEALTS